MNADEDIERLAEAENTLSPDIADHPAIVALIESNQSFLITDPKQPDNPIVYASQGFLDLTGFPLQRVLGRSCRFMQGPETDPGTVQKIRRAIDSGEDVSVCLLNYKADGSTFWNHLLITPVTNGCGEITHFLGVQFEVPGNQLNIIE